MRKWDGDLGLGIHKSIVDCIGWSVRIAVGADRAKSTLRVSLFGLQMAEKDREAGPERSRKVQNFNRSAMIDALRAPRCMARDMFRRARNQRALLEAPRRNIRTINSRPKTVNAMKDQLANDSPSSVQSTFEQSPAPRKIMGSARWRGKVSIIP